MPKPRRVFVSGERVKALNTMYPVAKNLLFRCNASLNTDGVYDVPRKKIHYPDGSWAAVDVTGPIDLVYIHAAEEYKKEEKYAWPYWVASYYHGDDSYTGFVWTSVSNELVQVPFDNNIYWNDGQTGKFAVHKNGLICCVEGGYVGDTGLIAACCSEDYGKTFESQTIVTPGLVGEWPYRDVCISDDGTIWVGMYMSYWYYP